MRVLVLGGGRFQGRRAAELLAQDGHVVLAVNRGALAPAGVQGIAGERDDLALLGTLLRQRSFDVVIDNLAYRREQVEGLLPLLTGRAGHYLLISSLAVYGPLRRFDPVPEEAAELDRTTGSEQDVGKRQCEAALVRGGAPLPYTVLRFCNVEGPGDPSGRRGFFIDRVADGGGLLLPSDLVMPFQSLWRDDAAAAVRLAAGNRRAFDRTYNIAGAEVLTLPEWLFLLAGAVGAPPPFLLHLPMAQLRQFAGFEYRLPLPLRPLLDTRRARQELGFTPAPLDHWLPATVAWWRGSGLASRFWDQRPRELAALRRARAALGLLAP